MRYRYDKPIEIKRSLKYGNNYYIFHSPKLGRSVTAYSNLEFYNLIALEMNHDVEWYCEQPVKAQLYDPLGHSEVCIPDVYIYYRNGAEEIQEVKYSFEYEGDGTETARAWGQRRREERWSRENGMAFSVRTEKEIIIGKSVQNLRYLCSRLRTGRIPGAELREKMQRYATPISTGVTLIDISDYTGMPLGVIIDCAAYMYWNGEIDIPDVFSDTALNKNSRITVKEG